MKAEILEEVKKEIEKMLNAGFIRPCRYAEWISSIVPVEKKDGRWRVAIDFRDLNRATPKDEYPMPVAETLINAAAGHKVLSFMDGNAGYNQIFMAPEDIHKTAFRVPGSVGLFEYVVMTFGLKNAGATYQRAMNYIFHDLIGKLVEIYIDDVVVKSVSVEGHLEDLRRILDRTRKFGLRMNPKKCAFGVTAGQFLGFLVHERGIEIGLKSQEAVRTMKPPTTKKELQCLIGKINFVRRFISNLSGRIEPFMGLPAKAVKGQALADLIAERINTDIAALSVRAWAMFFDGSACDDGCGIGILLVSPRGATYSFSIRLPTPCTNNVAEYEAIRKGMELLLEAGAEAVELFGDSKLVISQLTEEYKCRNTEANDLAQMASGYKDVAGGADVQDFGRVTSQMSGTSRVKSALTRALMSDSIEDLTELRLWSLEKIKENKAKVARAYNKKVRPKEFHVGDLVWEAVLPLGTKDAVYGKWSPNWHGPYRVDQVLKGNAYMLEELSGVKFPVAVNGQHLKKYFPRFVILDPTAVPIHLVPPQGGSSYAAIGSYSGIGSLEEEDWKERPEEAEEESMVAEEGFFRLLVRNRRMKRRTAQMRSFTFRRRRSASAAAAMPRRGSSYRYGGVSSSGYRSVRARPKLRYFLLGTAPTIGSAGLGAFTPSLFHAQVFEMFLALFNTGSNLST
ncbi:hypothetical protein QYE76_063541 [Lolium multiflorum]|uniref:Reverse transcriptase domain-containing protein n=1 Tax=Lolium multiflorum TaxID=4521 RepID=A0AAD8W6N9_LOLMU|nr:hypothetical protein QYE76_063541 [Lolium multiflorum]